MDRRVTREFLRESVLSAIDSNKALSTVADIDTVLRRSYRLFNSPFIPRYQIEETLKTLIPSKVRHSQVKNTRGADMYTLAERAPSRRELRVGTEGRLKAFWRWWYVDFTGVRTCDL